MIEIQGQKVIMSIEDYVNLSAGMPVMRVTEVSVDKSEDKTLEQEITDYLDGRGFVRHIKGFGLLRMVITLCVNKPKTIQSLTKELYATLAVETDSTASRVERAIRHAIQLVYKQDKPCNGEFIALASDEIRLKRS